MVRSELLRVSCDRLSSLICVAARQIRASAAANGPDVARHMSGATSLRSRRCLRIDGVLELTLPNDPISTRLIVWECVWVIVGRGVKPNFACSNGERLLGRSSEKVASEATTSIGWEQTEAFDFGTPSRDDQLETPSVLPG